MKSTQEHRNSLKHLSSILARVHKELMEYQFQMLEKTSGSAIPPGARLQILINDPQFAWLRQLSQLMALMDDTAFQKEPVTEEQMAAVKEGTKKLLFTPSDDEFSRHYTAICKAVPDLILEHGKVRAALNLISGKN
jgi:hypothetical protein